MKIYFTKYAEDNLAAIYTYHSAYSIGFADSFYDEITVFIISTLSAHPKIGHIHNKAESLYRLIFKQRYNIYYLIKDETIYILHILDGRLLLNEELAEENIPLPPVKKE